MEKPGIFITTNVFTQIAENEMLSPGVRQEIKDAWKYLNEVAEVEEFDGRFPEPDIIKEKVLDPSVQFIGCHLSHPIESSWLQESNVVAVSTATMGFDHVGRVPGVLITHTPGVLQNTVADYAMAMILATLRNTIKLHETVWSGNWKPGEKWDLDGHLSRSLDGQTVGIIGLGEIGSELARRVQPWRVKTLYYDIIRRNELEEEIPGLEFRDSMEAIFKESDVVSLNLPLNDHTRGIVNKDLLKLMKPRALLLNTARGGIINKEDLLSCLESGEVRIHLALDVHDPEPLDMESLERFRKIQEDNPDLRFTLAPHNASADADTRGRMARMILEDLAWLASSTCLDDLRRCRIIAAQRREIFDQGKISSYRIHDFWNR